MFASPGSHPNLVMLSGPEDFLAVVPYLLGYHPAESLVVVAFEGDKLYCVLRFDLPENSAHAADLAQECADSLERFASPGAFVIGYGPGSQVTPLMDGIFTMATASGVEIFDLIRCEDGRYWSYVSSDLDCSRDGEQYDVSTNPATLSAVMQGLVALPDRGALVQSVDPVGGPERARMREATARARARAQSLLESEDQHFWFPEGVRHITDCCDHVEASRPISADEMAWLGVLLTGIFVRDIALTLSLRYGEDVAMRLWIEVTRRVEPEYVPAPAVNLAMLALRSGDGSLARVAVNRALSVAPDYSFAQLITQALDLRLPPEDLRGVDFAVMADQITEIAADSPNGARPQLPLTPS